VTLFGLSDTAAEDIPICINHSNRTNLIMEGKTMLPLTAMTITRTRGNVGLSAVYAGVFSAIAALAMVLLFDTPALWPIAGILIGAGPVLGYDLARGQLGTNWRPLIGGLIGYILFAIGWIPFFVPLAAFAAFLLPVVAGILSVILWPIAVGAMSPNHSIGRLLLASLLGFVLGGLVMLAIVATIMGQDPGWLRIGLVLFWAIWAGTCGVAMAAWAK
jgi:hypothetical protein